jgi:hypothetical protein
MATPENTSTNQEGLYENEVVEKVSYKPFCEADLVIVLRLSDQDEY